MYMCVSLAHALIRNSHQGHLFCPLGHLRLATHPSPSLPVNILFCHLPLTITDRRSRFPRSFPFVVIDVLERLYLACFPLLQIFVTLFPLLTKKSTPFEATSDHSDAVDVGASAFEFLPLMVTSVYCAVGLVWAFIRLSVIYLARQD